MRVTARAHALCLRQTPSADPRGYQPASKTEGATDHKGHTASFPLRQSMCRCILPRHTNIHGFGTFLRLFEGQHEQICGE